MCTYTVGSYAADLGIRKVYISTVENGEYIYHRMPEMGEERIVADFSLFMYYMMFPYYGVDVRKAKIQGLIRLEYYFELKKNWRDNIPSRDDFLRLVALREDYEHVLYELADKVLVSKMGKDAFVAQVISAGPHIVREYIDEELETGSEFSIHEKSIMGMYITKKIIGEKEYPWNVSTAIKKYDNGERKITVITKEINCPWKFNKFEYRNKPQPPYKRIALVYLYGHPETIGGVTSDRSYFYYPIDEVSCLAARHGARYEGSEKEILRSTLHYALYSGATLKNECSGTVDTLVCPSGVVLHDV